MSGYKLGWIFAIWLALFALVAAVVWLRSTIRERRAEQRRMRTAPPIRWCCPMHGFIPDLDVGCCTPGKQPFHLGCGQEVRLTNSYIPVAWSDSKAPGKPLPLSR
jgi:hypothetical protein